MMHRRLFTVAAALLAGTLGQVMALRAQVAGQTAIPAEDGIYLVTRVAHQPEPDLLPLTSEEGPIWVELGARQRATSATVRSEDATNQRFSIAYGYPRTGACVPSVLRVDGRWRYWRNSGSDSLSCYADDYDVRDSPPGYVGKAASVLGTTPILWRETGGRITGRFDVAKPVFQRGEPIELRFMMSNPPGAPSVSRLDERVAWGPGWQIAVTRDGKPLDGFSLGGNRRYTNIEFPPGTDTNIRIALRDWTADLQAPGRYRVTLSHSEWFRDDGPDSPGGLRTFTGGVEFEVSATAFAGAVSVKGRVSGPPDLVAGVRTVMLDGEGRAAAESADVQADGSFEFPLIVTGTYTIRGVPDRLAPGRTIVVPDRDLVDVVLETPHRDVRGRVRLGPAGTIPAFALLIRPDIEGARDVRIAVRPAADGTLTVALPIGAWTAGIAEGLPAGIGIVSMTYGDTDLLRDRFVVAPEDGHELNIVLGRVTTAPMQFVAISPGEFAQGCTTDTPRCQPWEQPAHRVRITMPFEIGKYEVTQAQWVAVMTANPSGVRGDTLPVERVSWSDVQEFVRRLNGLDDGYRYRLPTEAEWEYVARAGMAAEPASIDGVAWMNDNAGGRTRPVGEKAPNGWGVYDMLGNVSEWIQDVYAPYDDGPATDPKGPSSGATRIVRGGGWKFSFGDIRTSWRSRNDPDQRNNMTGFRLVREPRR